MFGGGPGFWRTMGIIGGPAAAGVPVRVRGSGPRRQPGRAEDVRLHLGQVGRQVVGEPAVAGPEGLGPGGLGVPHDAEPIAEGLEGDYLVVPDPEPLPAPGEVDVLGREPEHPGVGVDRLLPLYGPAAEGAGPVVQAPGHPDAEALGGAAPLPAHDRLQIVNSLDHPDELLRLHQVEGDGPVHALPLWDDALGDVPEHRGLDQSGLDAVLVQGLLGQREMVRVPGQGVLLVQGEKTVLEGPLDGRFPGTDEEPVGFTLA